MTFDLAVVIFIHNMFDMTWKHPNFVSELTIQNINYICKIFDKYMTPARISRLNNFNKFYKYIHK